MKNIRVFLSENLQVLEVKFYVHLNRRVFVMEGPYQLAHPQHSMPFVFCSLNHRMKIQKKNLSDCAGLLANRDPYCSHMPRRTRSRDVLPLHAV